MAAPNEVRVKIRYNVLVLETFTVPQLLAITRLNRQSVYSEIRRMEREGLISRVGIEEREKGTTGGRPRIVYQLTPDPERRFDVLQFVRAFYVEAEEPPSKPPRPESKHYFIAKEMLKEVAEKETSLTFGERTEYLAQIRKRLEYARREEGVGEEGTLLIAASLDILEAKAIDILAGAWQQAIKILDTARQVCRQSGADDLVAEIEDYVRTIDSRMAEACSGLAELRQYEGVRETAANLQIIMHRFPDLPEISAHWNLAKQLAAEMQSGYIEERARGKLDTLRTEIATAQAQMQRTLIIDVEIAEPRYSCAPLVDDILQAGPTGPQLQPELGREVHRALARLVSDTLHVRLAELQLGIDFDQAAHRIRSARHPKVYRLTRTLPPGTLVE